ncbi:hypothetical protein [Duganella vulcania]|uniref:Uncharacterized protein n=1 Tax=Duganella vulcania TaxID=2692166 RepID=A0A845GGK4_9BURK|nr:hypothetical protein [Duganella vulcania]MYM92640.1 hypothetical protein [Duganella vulcania]
MADNERHVMTLAKQFWDGKRWDGHRAFNTVGHEHVSCYSPAEGYHSCEVMVVECADGRWYIEDNWGGDAKGAEKVWNPYDPSDAGPHFFDSEEQAMKHAVAVVAKVSGVEESAVSGI